LVLGQLRRRESEMIHALNSLGVAFRIPDDLSIPAFLKREMPEELEEEDRKKGEKPK
jgi:hypothetical protein